MKLSLSGKLFFGGAAVHVLGTVLERAANKLGKKRSSSYNETRAQYTPQNVIGHLTKEHVDRIQAYADSNGITWWNALEVFCRAWNEAGR